MYEGTMYDVRRMYKGCTKGLSTKEKSAQKALFSLFICTGEIFFRSNPCLFHFFVVILQRKSMNGLKMD